MKGTSKTKSYSYGSELKLKGVPELQSRWGQNPVHKEQKQRGFLGQWKDGKNMCENSWSLLNANRKSKDKRQGREEGMGR